MEQLSWLLLIGFASSIVLDYNLSIHTQIFMTFVLDDVMGIRIES